MPSSRNDFGILEIHADGWPRRTRGGSRALGQRHIQARLPDDLHDDLVQFFRRVVLHATFECPCSVFSDISKKEAIEEGDR